MTAILDLKGQLEKMPMMRGRRPESTEAERKATGAFVTLAPYRDGNIYSAKFQGEAAWERHPNGDELVQIIDGACTMHLMTDNGLEIARGQRRHDRRCAAKHLAPLLRAERGQHRHRDAAPDRALDGRCRRPTHAVRCAARRPFRGEVALD